MSHDIDAIRIEDNGGARFITLNRPDKANALSTGMLLSMTEAIATAAQDSIEAIVIRSASPNVFCAGGDIQEFSQGIGQLQEQGAQLCALMDALNRSPVPVLSIAQGKAAGAGVILISLSDIVIASERHTLSCPELHFGIYPFLVQGALETRVTPGVAWQMCMNGKAIPAAVAAEHGLVTEVLDLSDFESHAESRLTYYLERRQALWLARRTRSLGHCAQQLSHMLRQLESLTLENFSIPGVQDQVLAYLDTLGSRTPRKQSHPQEIT